jgi:heme-degrading monooxygenase HmoA
MIARITTVEAEADKLPGVIEFCQERLPGVRGTPGFQGFYLLADRQSGKVVTISLWDSHDDLQRNEPRGAQVREEGHSELGIAPTPADLYEVLLQA